MAVCFMFLCVQLILLYRWDFFYVLYAIHAKLLFNLYYMLVHRNLFLNILDNSHQIISCLATLEVVQKAREVYKYISFMSVQCLAH